MLPRWDQLPSLAFIHIQQQVEIGQDFVASFAMVPSVFEEMETCSQLHAPLLPVGLIEPPSFADRANLSADYSSLRQPSTLRSLSEPFQVVAPAELSRPQDAWH